MTLSEYIASARGNAVLLANHLGVSPSYISQLASGNRKASPSTAVEIENFTNKMVPRQTLRSEDWQKIWPELVKQSA